MALRGKSIGKSNGLFHRRLQWDSCNPLAHAATQDGTTSAVVQRETAAQHRAVPYVDARRPCLLTRWPGEGTLQAQCLRPGSRFLRRLRGRRLDIFSALLRLPLLA